MARNMNIDLELQCDVCFSQFDLENHRPKILQCGHTICKECLLNPALGRKCPTCRKHMAADPGAVPDNICVIRVMEKVGTGCPPRKVVRREDPKVVQLQRGVETARKVVQTLRQAVPTAVQALKSTLDSSVAHLGEMEEALDRLQRGAGTAEGDAVATPDLAAKQLRLQETLRLLTANKCTVVAEEDAGYWGASVQLGRMDDALRLLLLQLRADGHLRKAEGVGIPPPQLHLGPPKIPALTITSNDLEGGRLKVNDILRDKSRWRNVRTVNNLRGLGSEELLRMLAPHLEELKMSGAVWPSTMQVVAQMPCLKRLIVSCDDEYADYPDLPAQLEELSIWYPNERQLRSVLRMPRLRSLRVTSYTGAAFVIPPSPYGALLWLDLDLLIDNKDTMLALARSFGASLQELHVTCSVTGDDEHDASYLPDLGPDLATCGLRALRRLVLQRPLDDQQQCSQLGACLLQLRTVQAFLPPLATVYCAQCHASVL